MEAFAFDFDNPKIEKENAMLRYRRLRNLAKLFRILELCLLLIFISWISSRIPFILKSGKDYFRQLILIITSPLFIFLLSNVIVLTLFVKSGQLNTEKSDTNLYTEFTKEIEISVNSNAENRSAVSEEEEEEEEIVYQDKQIVGEINTSDSKSCSDSVAQVNLQLPDSSILEQKVLRRSQSENLKTEISEKPGAELSRSESEMSPKSEKAGESRGEIVEELSNEEFQRAIEAYIEKQLMFHKQEKFSIVPHV